ncbi:MAG: DUF835 domain-containing protein [Candidatus Altiarchaeales archaeon]|nr:DUF835 domain-containing protein [Candidatus Altiarchaeales archaeon]
MEMIPLTPELLFNGLGILLSLIAVYYWVQLSRRMYRRKSEFQGWVWLFTSAFAILLLNISSTYMLFSNVGVSQIRIPFYGSTVSFNVIQVVEVLSRTIIVFSMTVGVYLIYSKLKTGFVYALMPVGLEQKALSKEKLKYELNTSMSYIISESNVGETSSKSISGDRSSVNSMHVFTDLVSHGAYGLIITREHPKQVRRNWDVDSLPVIWLTTSGDLTGEAMENVQYLDPADLIGLSHAIKDFIKKSDNNVILFDCIEYMITQNSFSEVLKFIQSLNDSVSQSKSRLLVPLDYKAVDERELHLLKRELHEITVV